MEDLVKIYSDFSIPLTSAEISRDAKSGKTIVSQITLAGSISADRLWLVQLLTGGTGSLGTFLISQLAQLPPDIVKRIICLVRASDDQKGKARVVYELEQRDMVVDMNRIDVFASDLSDEMLGLGKEVYRRLVDEVDVVVHVGWHSLL